jgi:hypothetical protein
MRTHGLGVSVDRYRSKDVMVARRVSIETVLSSHDEIIIAAFALLLQTVFKSTNFTVKGAWVCEF